MRYAVKIVCILVLLAGSAYAVPVNGDMTASKEELLFIEVPSVFAAARYEQKVTEAPSFVTVITDKEIKEFGYRTLAEALRGVTGFYTTNDREYVRLGVRGYARPGDWGNRILVMVNGHYYNEDIFGATYSDNTFGIDLDLVKRIEIIRGAASALYGTNALFAVINVITKTGEELEGVNAAIEYGTNNAIKPLISIGKKLRNNSNVLISGSQFNSDGFKRLYFPEFDNPPAGDGWAVDLDHENAYRLFANVNHEGISVFANTCYRKKAFPTAVYGTIFNDSRASDTDKRSFIEAKFQSKFSEDKAGLVRVYYDNYNYVGDYPTDYPPPTLNRDNDEGSWVGSEIQLNWDITPANKLIVGSEYQDHFQVYQKNFDVETGVTYLDDNHPFNIWSIYLQDEIKTNNVALTLGLRDDNHPDFGSVLNPRVGLVFNPAGDHYLKFLYGKAFRAPTPFEKYYNDGLSSKSNLTLKPEIINGYEFVYEQGSLLDLYSALSIYKNYVSDIITQVIDPSDSLLQYQNVDKVSTNGVDLNLRKTFGGGAYGHISYSYQKAINENTGQILTNSPENSGNLGLVFPVLSRKTTLASELIYLDKRLTLGGNYVQPYLLANLTLRTEGLFGLETTLKINNLFDAQYADPASGEHSMDTIAQDGRTYSIKVSRTF